MNAEYKRNRAKGINWAILLICAGSLLLLFNIGIIPAIYKPILISWQMLLIVLGAGALMRGRHLNGLVLIAIGGIFIYSKLYSAFSDFLPNMNINLSTYWPVILIGIGILLIFGKNKIRKHHNTPINRWKESNINSSDPEPVNKTEFIDKNIMFASSEQIVLSKNFRGGEGNIMFGELKIDLRKATLNEDIAELEINIMFGSAIIYVPSNWKVNIQNSSLFGGFRDNRSIQDAEDTTDAQHLVITGGCLFGGGEIRN